MRYLYSFLFFITYSYAHLTNGSLDNHEIEYIKSKKTINVCINPDWAPIEFREGDIYQGISIDILKLISNKIGLGLNFVYTSTWSESQKFLKNGKCDITPTAIKTQKREKYAIFTKPYLSYDLAIITTQDKPYVTDILAILDKTITRKKGSGLISKLKREFPNIKMITPNSFREMFELVNDDKVYATIATLPVFSYYKKRYNLNNLKIAGFTGWKYPLRIMLNKNETELKEILDTELRLISPKMTQKIYEKWMVKTKPEFNYREFFIILGIIGIIFIILSYWIYTLYSKNKELKRLSAVKSKFLANMSHELRTPLNALIGFIQIIKQNPKECSKYIPLIDSSSKVILTEIDDILNFDRLKKHIDLDNTKFSNDEFKNLMEFFELEIKKKGLDFNFHIDTPEYLNGDIGKIRDVLIHLLDNALKFTDNGKIDVSIKYDNEFLLVSIKDTGVGISEENFKVIFKEFIQLDLNLNKKYKGIGLGLSISEKLVKVLGGKLKVKSVLDKGSEFYFKIPLEKLKEQSKIYNNKSLSKILVVEDNKANQMFMKVILKKLNVEFDMAENGQIAFDMYQKSKYPLILMDINMPVMDGIEATKQIRKFEKINKISPSKIVAVTANAIDGDKEKFLEAGMNDYIPKPVDIEKLKSVLI